MLTFICICIPAALRSEKGAVAKTGPGVGKAAIGGPFKLVNQDGKVVTDRDFLGNWSLIYFGFTYCPDICPDELTKLAEAIDKIGWSSHYPLGPILCTHLSFCGLFGDVGMYCLSCLTCVVDFLASNWCNGLEELQF